MEKILNFRKLAAEVRNNDGRKIKNIYRSADVSNASENDIEQLLALDCKTIIDLRSAEEITTLLSNQAIEIYNIDIIGNGDQNKVDQFAIADLEQLMLDLYQVKFIETDGFKAELEFIHQLDGKPFLFHCTAGKDRTGITGAILMYLLGFNREHIIAEYLKIDELLVNVMMTKAHDQFEAMNIDVDIDGLRAVAGVDSKFINGYINGIVTQFETVENYIETKLGVSPELREYLKTNYLE